MNFVLNKSLYNLHFYSVEFIVNFEIYYEGWRKSLTIILLFKILLIIYLTKSYSIFSLIQKNLNNYSIIFLSFYFLLSLSPPTDADS